MLTLIVIINDVATLPLTITLIVIANDVVTNRKYNSYGKC